MGKFFLRLYRFFERHRALMYALLVFSAAFFAFGGSRLRFEENIFKLLPQTDAATESGVAFTDIKVKDKVFIQFTAKEGRSVAVEDLIAAEDSYLERLELSDSSTRYIDSYLCQLTADDAMNALYYALEHIPAYLGDDAYKALDTLLTKEKIEQLSNAPAREVMKGLGEFEIIDSHIFSSDSTVALTFLSPAIGSDDSYHCDCLLKLMEAQDRRIEEDYPDIEVLHHGTIPGAAFNSRQCKKDLAITVSLSLLIILLVICVCFKTKRTLVHLVVPVLYGLLCALCSVYLIKGSMSLIAIGIGAMILGAALSYCLHVLTHQKYVCDVGRIILEQSKPICLGCITTVGAFVGLIFTSSELLKDFGIFASFTLLGTTFFSLVFLPHFLRKRDALKNETAFHIIRKINSYPIYRNVPVVLLVTAVSVFSLFTADRVKFDSDLNNIGYLDGDFIRSTELYKEKFEHGLASVYYAGFSADLNDAIMIERNIEEKMKTLKEEGAIYSYSSASPLLVPLAEQEINIDKWNNYWTARRSRKVARLLQEASDRYNWSEDFDVPGTFQAMMEAEYAPESILETDMLPQSLLCNFVEKTDEGYLVFCSALMDPSRKIGIGKEITSVPGAVVVDPYFYTGDMVEIIKSDFNIVLNISSIFVLIVLLLSFRSILAALLAFLPMFLSWYIVRALMALFGIEFNLISIMISTFIFGIGVDYSIFMVEGLIDKARNGHSDLLGYHKAAIILSVFIMMVVTCSLLFARHPAIYSVGIATLIGMIATVLITYSIQPLVFKLLMRMEIFRKRILK